MRVPFEKSVAEVSLWQFLQNQVDAIMTVCYNQLNKSEVMEEGMEKFSALLMTVAIVCALFSDKSLFSFRWIVLPTGNFTDASLKLNIGFDII